MLHYVLTIIHIFNLLLDDNLICDSPVFEHMYHHTFSLVFDRITIAYLMHYNIITCCFSCTMKKLRMKM